MDCREQGSHARSSYISNTGYLAHGDSNGVKQEEGKYHNNNTMNEEPYIVITICNNCYILEIVFELGSRYARR